MSDIRKKTIEGLRVGDLFTVSRKFAQKDVINFSKISKDFNPVHFEKRFAKTKGFDRRICHGLLVGSLITEIGGQIGWLASSISFKFKKPVYFDDAVTCDFTITDLNDKGRAVASAVFKNQEGTIVMEADLKGIIPIGEDQEVLRQMVEEGDPTNKIKDVKQ
jgi:acyl dehydratase